MKICSKCSIEKEVTDFYEHTVRGEKVRRADCKECNKQFHRDNPITPTQARRKNLKALYNITPEQFDKMMEGGCGVCGTYDDLCVDHDHSCCPGKKSCGSCIRGLLCQRHNKAEGFLRSSAEEARALADYLERTATTQ